MTNNKLTFFPGLSLFLCFCLLDGLGWVAARFGAGAPFIALAEAAAFILPMLLVVSALREPKTLLKRLRRRRFPEGVMGLSVKLGMSVALLSLFLNLLIYQIAGLAGADLTTTALGASQTGMSLFGKLLVIVVLSAVVEEFYLRGALLLAHEQRVGTGACLVFSGIVFALLHSSVSNLFGPLVAGIAYGYLTYSFGSVWPAVIAHAVNNLYYVFVLWLTDTYAAFGIWNYFAAVNAILLLLFLYLTLRGAETLLAKGYIPHMEKGAGLYDLFLLVRDPGVLAFAVAFVVKVVLRWI